MIVGPNGFADAPFTSVGVSVLSQYLCGDAEIAGFMISFTRLGIGYFHVGLLELLVALDVPGLRVHVVGDAALDLLRVPA